MTTKNNDDDCESTNEDQCHSNGCSPDDIMMCTLPNWDDEDKDEDEENANYYNELWKARGNGKCHLRIVK